VILLDTSTLVDALSGPRRSAAALRRAIEHGERVLLPSLVLYEWLRGPRLPEELEAQEALFPAATALVFGPGEAARAAQLYLRLGRARGREIDLAIAACALTLGARLWTLNPRDFRDLPGLELYTPT
jgi:predicted nucleic acid-binding protein